MGGSGLQVSRIGFGNMINFKPEDEEVNTEIIKRCYDAGINFFDTAEKYYIVFIIVMNMDIVKLNWEEPLRN